MNTWIIGCRKDGPRPRSTYPNARNILSKIEQGIVFDLFRYTSMNSTVTPNLFMMGGRLSGMGPISNYTITSNSISWKSQQSTTFTLVRGGIVADRILIPTPPCNINLCSPITIWIVAGILWPIPTYINISSAITRGKVAGHTWPMSTT